MADGLTIQEFRNNLGVHLSAELPKRGPFSPDNGPRPAAEKERNETDARGRHLCRFAHAQKNEGTTRHPCRE
jgi:hypothetical protein